MDADTQHALIRRVHAHLAARTTDISGDGPTQLPVDRYLDPDRHAREVAALFRGLPIAVAHRSQLAAPGDFLTHDALGVPLLLVRTDDGALVAHRNVCRHRGTRLVAAPCGAARAFVCPYHAWSYARDGTLLGIPHAGGFAGLDRADLALSRVPVREEAGLIFVQVEGAPQSVSAFLGSTATELAGFDLATAHVYAPRSVTKQLSWKLTIDVFLETYHLRTAHKDTIYRLFFDNTGLVDRVGPHLRTVFPKRSIRELAEPPTAAWQLRAHANVLYHLFPNTLILVQPDHAAVFHTWPVGPGRARIDSYTLVPERPVTEKAQRYWDANNALLYAAVDEDLALGESIQAGLASGANAAVIFGEYEHALAHFHDQVERLTPAAAS